MGEKSAVDILKKMKSLADELCETNPDLNSLFPKGSKDNVLSLIKDIQRELETLKVCTKSDIKRIQDLGKVFETLRDSEVDYLHHQDINNDIKEHLDAFCRVISSQNPILLVKCVGGYIKRGYTFTVEPTFKTASNLSLTFTVKTDSELVITFDSKNSPYKIPGMMFKSDVVKLDTHFEHGLSLIIKDLAQEIFKPVEELLTKNIEKTVIVNGRSYLGYEFNNRSEVNNFIERYQRIGLEFGVLQVKDDLITVAKMKDLGR